MGNFFDRLFGKRRVRQPMRDVAALTSGLSEPAIHLVATAAPSLSHFGGSPRLPPGCSWPEGNGRKLSFLARVSLKDMHCALALPWLPDSGALLFFYDEEEEPWGYDPHHRGGSAVLLVPDLAVALEQPAEKTDHLPHQNLAFRRIDRVPPADHDSVAALHLSPDESRQFEKLANAAFDDQPRHQISGYPMSLQDGDMALECQLASNGIYCGDGNELADPRALALATGAKDWRLLLQFDTDDDLGVMWGDSGTVYFWVQEQEARRGNFTNTWVVLQCF